MATYLLLAPPTANLRAGIAKGSEAPVYRGSPRAGAGSSSYFTLFLIFLRTLFKAFSSALVRGSFVGIG